MAIEIDAPPMVKGLFKSDIRPGERELRWFAPCDRLSPFVQRLWFARWAIPAGEHRIQVLLPHPSANFVFAEESTSVIDVMTRSAVQRLEGNGMAFGAKLQPGALRAFGVIEPWRLRDAAVPASSPFRGCWSIYHEDRPRVLAAEVEAYLIALQPRHDSLSLKASEIAQIAEDNLNISSVASLADRLGLSQRSVQEICHRGLGVHPKWLIRCFRLQDAALRLEAEANVSLPGLAQGLGYFDQAHFTRDFKRATGVSPGQYRLSAHAGAEASA